MIRPCNFQQENWVNFEEQKEITNVACPKK